MVDRKREILGSVRRAVRRLAGAAQRHTPTAVMAVICASAFVPLIAVAGPAAAAQAAIGLVGGVGGNALADTLVRAVNGMRPTSRPEGDAPATVSTVEAAALEEAVAAALSEVLARNDDLAEQLRLEMSEILISLGVGTVAIEAAAETGSRELLHAVATGFDDLAAQFDQLRADHRQQDRVLRQILRRSIDAGVELRVLRDEIAAVRHARQRPGADHVSHSAPDWAGDESPYRGLKPFEQDDSAVFYGREYATARLVAFTLTRLDDGGMTIVTGASGAGKSSILHAGLLPRFTNGTATSGSQAWPQIVMRPEVTPLATLANHLADASGTDPVTVHRHLREDPSHAATYARQATRTTVGAPDRRLLLVVDQFEEIFRIDDEEERNQFIDALHAIAARQQGVTTPAGVVVLGLRGDFVEPSSAYPKLARALQDGQWIVPPMTRDDLRLALAGPATTAGLVLEDGLADDILTSLVDAGRHHTTTSVLPLLSQTMYLVWQERDGRHLTRHGYGRVGGIRRVVAHTADEVLNSMDLINRDVAEAVFRQLVALSSDGKLMRRPMTFDDLTSVAPGTADVVELFVQQRLLVRDQSRVQISHDIVLQEWPQLRLWFSEDLKSQIVRSQVIDDAKVWEGTGRPDTSLYQGPQLQAALQARETWRAGRLPAAGPAAEAFLTDAEASARHTTTRRNMLVTATAVVTIAALVVGGLMWRAQQQRDLIEAVGRSQQLASDSEAARGEDGQLAKLLAAAAWKVSPTAEARTALTRAAAEDPSAGLISPDVGKSIYNVAFSPDGTTVASRSENGIVRLWDVTTWNSYELPGRASAPGGVSGQDFIAFSPDGNLLSASSFGQIITWNVVSRDIAWSKNSEQLGTFQVAFNEAGTLLALVGSNNIEIFDSSTGDMTTRIDAESLGNTAVFDSPTTILTVTDGTTSQHQTIQWDALTGKVTARNTDQFGIVRLQKVGDTGDIIGCGSSGCTSVKSQRPGSTEVTLGEIPADEAIVSQDGKHLVLLNNWGVSDGEIVVVSAASGTLETRFRVIGDFADIALSPDGSMIVAASQTGIQTWRIGTASGSGFVATQAGQPPTVSPDGRTAASIDGGRIVRWQLPQSVPSDSEISATETTIDISPGIQSEGYQSPETSFADRIFRDDSTGGQRIAVVSDYTHLTVIDVTAGTAVQEIELVDGNFSKVVVDDSYVAIAPGYESNPMILDPQGRRIAKLPGHSQEVLDLAIGMDGTRVATVDDSETIRVWALPGGDLLEEFQVSIDEPSRLTWGINGTRLYIIGKGLVRHEILGGGDDLTIESDGVSGYNDILLTPDERYALVSNLQQGGGGLSVWDLQNRTLAAEIAALRTVDLPEPTIAAETSTLMVPTPGGIQYTDLGFLTEPLDAVCDQVQRDLTREERSLYLSADDRDLVVCNR